ncbi:hypothetical protein HDU82_001018 [Entophlyctis luteolus]|nr:hypothetical protein HDU82_001018 [Entophlyctis luteolus]KAJ3392533.1 hypothetical protein HDU84_004018 [Entophlyctis sp. JEL0112]
MARPKRTATPADGASTKQAAAGSTGIPLSALSCYSFLCTHSDHTLPCYSYSPCEPTKPHASADTAEPDAPETPKKSSRPKRGAQEADSQESPAPNAKRAKVSLAVGDSIPASFDADHSLFLQNHTPFHLYKESQESGIVLFFYPKANTPGCTSQACNYRDNLDSFSSKGFKVFGVSMDSEKSLTNWKEKQKYQYDFVSDKDKAIIDLFGVGKPGGGIIRSHVVIAKGGSVAHTRIPTPAKESWSDALEAIENL